MAWNINEEFSYTTADEPVTREITITKNIQQYLVLVLGSSDGRDYRFTSATFDGDDLTRIYSVKQDASNGDAALDVQYIDISDKASGTYDLYYNVSTGGPDDGGIACITVTGSSGDSIVTNTFADKDVGSGVGNPSTSITTEENNSIVIDAFYTKEGAGNLTPGSGQTQIFQKDPGDQNRYGMSYKEVSSAGSTTMSWSGSNEEWAQVSFAFSPTSPLTLDVSDSISISESISFTIDRILSVSDNVELSESTKVLLESLTGVSDSVTLSEHVDVTIRDGGDLNISVWRDNISVGDKVEWPGPRDLQILDESITVSEKVTIKIKKEEYETKPTIRVSY